MTQRRTALITGALAGIGLSFARVFAEHGFNLVLTARREDRLQAIASDLTRQHGVSVRIVAADLADPSAPKRLFDDLGRAGVAIDALVQAASLGLLALLLGFTFSMALSRYDPRRQLVLEEANAIGTTYLRTQLLPEPARREVSNLLRRYVDVRLEFYRAGISQSRLQRVDDDTEKLHRALWSYAIAAGGQDPRAIPTGLFIQSLNEVIYLHAKRVTALENHVPESIFVLP